MIFCRQGNPLVAVERDRFPLPRVRLRATNDGIIVNDEAMVAGSTLDSAIAKVLANLKSLSARWTANQELGII
jgi:hypothetical protein